MCRVKGCLYTQDSAHLCGSRFTDLDIEKSVPKIYQNKNTSSYHVEYMTSCLIENADTCQVEFFTSGGLKLTTSNFNNFNNS